VTSNVRLRLIRCGAHLLTDVDAAGFTTMDDDTGR
jgi:hypothetical protein